MSEAENNSYGAVVKEDVRMQEGAKRLGSSSHKTNEKEMQCAVGCSFFTKGSGLGA